MKKKILVISYSQTGQLSTLVENFTQPLADDENFELIFKNIKPKKPYPFPWDMLSFMEIFPESAHMIPCEIENIEDDENDYDLIILAYSVWFLSPSIPISSFLQTSYAQKKLKNKPVITLIGCRNMWIMAQEKVKKALNHLGATLIDNVVLVDRGNSLETFITTPRWMLTGKKDSFLGLSSAGIDENEIKNSTRFGRALRVALKNNEEKKQKSLLRGLRAVNVDIKLIKSEKIGNKSFLIWGKLIRKSALETRSRRIFVIIYLLFLLLMICTIVPLNMIVQGVLLKLNKKSILKQKEFYEQPSGSDDYMMKEFL